MENNLKVIENRLRRHAKKQGLKIEKSRVRNTHFNNQGGYQLIDYYTNAVIKGANYDLSLEEISNYIENQFNN